MHERAGYHQALELAADMLVANAETIAGLRTEIAHLILMSKRAERTS